MAPHPVRALGTFGKNVWKLATSPVKLGRTPAYKKLTLNLGSKKITVKARNDLELDLINPGNNTIAKLQLNGQTLYLPNNRIISVSSSASADLQVPVKDVHFLIHIHNGAIKIENVSLPDSKGVIGVTDTVTEEFTALAADESLLLSNNSIVGVKLSGEESGAFQMFVKVAPDAIDQLREEQARRLLADQFVSGEEPVAAKEQARLEQAIFSLGLLDETVFAGAASTAEIVEIDRINMGNLDQRALAFSKFYEALKIIGMPVSFMLGTSFLGFGMDDGFGAHPYLNLSFLASLLSTTNAFRAASQTLSRRFGRGAHYEPAYTPDSRAAKKMDNKVAQVLAKLPAQTAADFLHLQGAGRRRHLLNLLRQEVGQLRLDQIVLGVDKLQKTKHQAETEVATEAPPANRARQAARAQKTLA